MVPGTPVDCSVGLCVNHQAASMSPAAHHTNGWGERWRRRAVLITGGVAVEVPLGTIELIVRA
jgi:hypothetical protein